MSLAKKSAVAMALAGAVSAQSSSVVNIFFPDIDNQALVGSIITSVSSDPT